MPRELSEQEELALQRAQVSVIGQGMQITGNLKSDGVVQIDGAIKGDLEAARIVVGENGVIEGNLDADTVEVHGFIQGNITARVADFRAIAHVVGDTAHQDLRVEKGACLDGNFKNTGQSTAKSTGQKTPKG